MNWLQAVTCKMELWVLLGARTRRTRKTVQEKAVPSPLPFHGYFSVLLSESVRIPLTLCASDADARSPCVG